MRNVTASSSQVPPPRCSAVQRPSLAKAIAACLLALGAALPLTASAADPLVRFEDGIGVQPLRAGPAPNTVFGVPPGGVPWVISRLSADVSSDGRILVDGRGLLLAGNNATNSILVGTNGGQSVRARLFCSGVPFDSQLVPLDERGDFQIQGVLNAMPPSPCVNPVLLIVSGNGSWFAAGIPKR